MKRLRLVFTLCVVAAPAVTTSGAQAGGFGVCRPISDRKSEIGCWIIGEQPLGRIDRATTYWHLDAYPSRAEAERARGPHGMVLDALGRTWLMSVEPKGWRPGGAGERVAEIGPIPISAGRSYAALFMEAVMTPGMASAVHRHSGPEVWYTAAGQTCLETPDGRIVGRPGEPAIVPEGPPMYLTAIGKTQRRAIVLILHDASRPPTTMEEQWKPKGLCK